MPTAAQLVTMLSGGNGRWFATCHWCHRSTSAHDTPDDLRMLADAKTAGWLATKQADGMYRLACKTCQRQRGIA